MVRLWFEQPISMEWLMRCLAGINITLGDLSIRYLLRTPSKLGQVRLSWRLPKVERTGVLIDKKTTGLWAAHGSPDGGNAFDLPKRS